MYSEAYACLLFLFGIIVSHTQYTLHICNIFVRFLGMEWKYGKHQPRVTFPNSTAYLFIWSLKMKNQYHQRQMKPSDEREIPRQTETNNIIEKTTENEKMKYMITLCSRFLQYLQSFGKGSYSFERVTYTYYHLPSCHMPYVLYRIPNIVCRSAIVDSEHETWNIK